MDNFKSLTIEEKLIKSNSNIIINFGFFATLLLRLNLKEDNNFPTMGTDGEVLLYNTKFVNSLTFQELNFVLVHEVLHCALGHVWRRDERNSQLWNIACDYAVNALIMDVVNAYCKNDRYNQLTTDDNFQLPKGALYDTKYDGMSADEIYTYLFKNAKFVSMGMPSNGSQGSKSSKSNSQGNDGENGNNSGNGNKSSKGKGNNEGDVIVNGKKISSPKNHDKWSKTSGDKAEQLANDWDSRLVAANETMKSCGITSSALDRCVAELVKPQKNWRLLLQEFIQEEINDYSLMPPDKRYDDNSFFMFDFNDSVEVVNDILFFVDTSGSMSTKEITTCFSEIQGAINQFNKHLHGTLLFFDSSVQTKTYDFDDVNGDISHIIPSGGGGTSFNVIFKYAKDNRDKFNNINGIIILTDGECNYPKESETDGIPTLWIYTQKNMEPPFGRYAHLDVE